jgi:hypothetical protein
MRKLPTKTVPLNKAAASVLGLKKFAAISAVEGLKLSPKGLKRVSGAVSTDKRRADVIRAYLDLKARR